MNSGGHCCGTGSKEGELWRVMIGAEFLRGGGEGEPGRSWNPENEISAPQRQREAKHAQQVVQSKTQGSDTAAMGDRDRTNALQI